MGLSDCLPEKGTKLMFAAILMLGAVAWIVLGFTVLPIIGFIAAIPFAAVSIYFYKLHLNDQCQLNLGQNESGEKGTGQS